MSTRELSNSHLFDLQVLLVCCIAGDLPRLPDDAPDATQIPTSAMEQVWRWQVMILDDLSQDPPEDPDPVPDTLRSGDVCAGCSEDCEECELKTGDLNDIEDHWTDLEESWEEGDHD